MRSKNRSQFTIMWFSATNVTQSRLISCIFECVENVNNLFCAQIMSYTFHHRDILPQQSKPEQYYHLKQVFFESDNNQKGFLDREDLKVAVLSLLGYKPSKIEVDEILGSKEGITLQCFMDAMLPKLAAEDEDDQIRQVFMSFDMQCKGFITAGDLERVFSEVAPHIPRHLIQAAFSFENYRGTQAGWTPIVSATAY
ncbi:EF-hand calcium-binding domain-containing protein 11-like isoform X2 [Anneissia japonica]|uniref:EF-hand calcium-binding domain-containing protein 11-like isoform X2 n=1 Tax=Anneissia japonica TaxID=1529436 RepID=UPI001425A86A|nr:EF-hand calcium-binding domain-containing protein 11-like isoform X2 [Anneissia japonica]